MKSVGKEGKGEIVRRGRVGNVEELKGKREKGEGDGKVGHEVFRGVKGRQDHRKEAEKERRVR